jgi:hypothetical protein
MLILSPKVAIKVCPGRESYIGNLELIKCRKH